VTQETAGMYCAIKSRTQNIRRFTSSSMGDCELGSG